MPGVVVVPRQPVTALHAGADRGDGDNYSKWRTREGIKNLPEFDGESDDDTAPRTRRRRVGAGDRDPVHHRRMVEQQPTRPTGRLRVGEVGHSASRRCSASIPAGSRGGPQARPVGLGLDPARDQVLDRQQQRRRGQRRRPRAPAPTRPRAAVPGEPGRRAPAPAGSPAPRAPRTRARPSACAGAATWPSSCASSARSLVGGAREARCRRPPPARSARAVHLRVLARSSATTRRRPDRAGAGPHLPLELRSQRRTAGRQRPRRDEQRVDHDRLQHHEHRHGDPGRDAHRKPGLARPPPDRQADGVRHGRPRPSTPPGRAQRPAPTPWRSAGRGRRSPRGRGRRIRAAAGRPRRPRPQPRPRHRRRRRAEGRGSRTSAPTGPRPARRRDRARGLPRPAGIAARGSRPPARSGRA